jgi:hypothetical protein
MSTRIGSGECMMCGDILIHPYNDYNTCSKCTEIIKKVQYDISMKKRRNELGKPKRNRTVHINRIILQTKPRGQVVK